MKKIMTICAIFLAFALIAAAIGFTLNKKPMLKITAENFEELTFNLFLVEVPTYYVMRITPDRKVVYEEYQYYPVPDELQAQSEKVLSEEKYNQLIDTLNKNSFMELPEDLSTESYDGAIINVEVKVNGVLHKVGGLNPMGVNKRFDKVHELVNQLLEFTNTDYETIPDPYQQIGEYLRSAVKEAHIPGMAIAIVDKYSTRFSNIYGNGKSIDAPFLIGSITKSFTALAVMQLAEQGKIDLDKSVAKYLPGLGVDGRITIRQLLNQTSGFSTYQTRQSLTVTDSHNKHIYANVNYGLLGEVIEAVSGISYEEYIEENIYKPIGMNHSYTSLEDAKSGGLVTGYQNYFGFFIPKEIAFPDGQGWSSVASGYLSSSISDMGKYLQMYLNDGSRVVAPDSIRTVFYDNVYDESSDTYYGMGWVLHTGFAEPVLMHSGNVENYIANMFILPESGIGVVMLINTNDYLAANGMMGRTALNIISILTGMPPVGPNGTSYLAAHLLINTIYLAIFLISLIPVFFIKRVNGKRKIKTIVTIGLLHVAYPSFILFAPPLTLAPFFVIQGYVPDLFMVLAASAVLAYGVGIVKIILLWRKRKDEKIGKHP